MWTSHLETMNFHLRTLTLASTRRHIGDGRATSNKSKCNMHEITSSHNNADGLFNHEMLIRSAMNR